MKAPLDNTAGTSALKNKKYLIHSTIGLILMFGVGYLPPLSPITPLGMKYLGILLGLIYLWSLVEMLWPSMLGLVALLLTGTISGAELTPKAFGADMIILVILSLAVVFSLTNTGMFDYVTNYVLTRPSLKGHPWRMTFAIIMGQYVITALGGGLAIMFLLWEMTYAIASKAGIERSHRWCGAMVVGLILAFVSGLGTLPFKPSFLFVVGTFQRITGLGDIPMLLALVMNLAMYISMICLYILLMKVVLRVDIRALENADTAAYAKELPPMNKTQKFALIYLALFIIGLMIPGTIGLFSQGPVSKLLQSMGTIGMCILFFGLLCMIKIDGQHILVFSKVAPQVQWDSVALMAIAFTLSPMLTGEGTGISEWMMGVVNPLLGGKSPLTFTIMLFVLTIILTNIANNTVIMILMMTVASVYIGQLDLNLPLMALLMNIMSQVAFLLPASSFYGALAHSQASSVTTKNIYLASAMTVVAAVLMMLLVGIPLGNLLF